MYKIIGVKSVPLVFFEVLAPDLWQTNCLHCWCLLQMTVVSVCWKDISAEEVARKCPWIRYIIDKNLIDQICYIYIHKAALLEIHAESISNPCNYIIFLPNNQELKSLWPTKPLTFFYNLSGKVNEEVISWLNALNTKYKNREI